MPFLATYFALALGGLVDAGYLTYKHSKKSKGPLACPMNHDCSVVTESKWASTFGIRNDALGVAFYAASIVAGFIMLFMPAYIPLVARAAFFATLGASCVSIVLLWIQYKVIKDYCFYCIVSAIINLLLLVNTWWFVSVT